MKELFVYAVICERNTAKPRYVARGNCAEAQSLQQVVAFRTSKLWRTEGAVLQNVVNKTMKSGNSSKISYFCLAHQRQRVKQPKKLHYIL